MAFNINEIRSQLTYGGARQNLFQVSFTNLGNNVAFNKIPFLVQASSIPSADVGTIAIPYFGRQIKLAGDRSFAPWAVTVMNDEDFLIRNALEEWSNKINGLETNLRRLANYKSEAEVIQYGKDGTVLRKYVFHGIFPSSVSAIGLNWADNDSIETFDVEFQYDWWTVDGGNTGNPGK